MFPENDNPLPLTPFVVKRNAIGFVYVGVKDAWASVERMRLQALMARVFTKPLNALSNRAL